MKIALFAFLFFVVHITCLADGLRFDEPIDVIAASKGVFLHLDASGRRSLSVSEDTVAVVWEDNSKGKPAVYVSYLAADSRKFSKAEKVSGDSAAYEPVIVALTNKQFLVGWEEDDRVWLREIAPSQQGKPVKLSTVSAKQLCLASDGNGKVSAVWAQGPVSQQNSSQSSSVQGEPVLYFSDVTINEGRISFIAPQLVDNSTNKTSQLYPVIEISNGGRLVAWEDRRHGHTRIFTAFAPQDKSFEDYQLLNEFSPPPNPEFGKGSGAMRPVVAGDGKQSVIAAWMDKRNWRSGYDVYAALSTNAGKKFGRDEKAQDAFAEDIPQWHASVALRAKDGLAVVAWDDTRNESPDVFYSLRTKDNWSDDYELPGASGPGRQTHPAIIFDRHGRLHAVWLDNANGQLTLRYTRSSQ